MAWACLSEARGPPTVTVTKTLLPNRHLKAQPCCSVQETSLCTLSVGVFKTTSLPFLEEIGSKKYHSGAWGRQRLLPRSSVAERDSSKHLSEPTSCKCVFRMACVFSLLENGDASPLFHFVFAKYHFTLSILSYHGNQPEGCRHYPKYFKHTRLQADMYRFSNARRKGSRKRGVNDWCRLKCLFR